LLPAHPVLSEDRDERISLLFGTTPETTIEQDVFIDKLERYFEVCEWIFQSDKTIYTRYLNELRTKVLMRKPAMAPYLLDTKCTIYDH